MVGYQKHVGLQALVERGLAGDDGAFLRRGDVAWQQGGALAVADAQYAAHAVGFGAPVVGIIKRVQEAELHAIPLPALPCQAWCDGVLLVQGVRAGNCAYQMRLRVLACYRGCAADVVGIAVAQDDVVGALIKCCQQGQQHALACVAVGAVLRTRVK